MSWATAWRIARRDLNARFRGLRLLLVCLFLGTGALAAIGSLTAAINSEIEANGRNYLGGDLQIELWQRSLNEEERAALNELGDVSAGTRLQAMARYDDQAAPIELKAVDQAYPLYGELTLEDGRSVNAPSADEAWLSQGAADRLGVAPGDTFAIGTATLRAGGIIENEPDRLGEGFQLGPTIIVAEDLPVRAGLTAPGSMYQSKTRVRFTQERDLEAVEEALEDQFPEAGFDIDTADRAAPGTDRFVNRMSEFLTLVGLAALVIAGIGIGGGVTSYLDARRQGIATLKILGASSTDISRIYALQIVAASLVGSIAGIAVGAAVSAGMASVVDLGGPDRRRQASLLASVSMVLGAGLGPLLAGSLALALPEPILPIFGAELAILASATLLVFLLPLREGTPTASAAWRLRLPSVPQPNRRHLAFGIAVFGPGITATSFVLSLGPSLLSRLIGVASPLIAGAMACGMFLTATGVQFLARSRPVRTIFLLGASATVLSMVGIGIAVAASSAVALIVAALLAGSGQGLGQLGGLTLIGLHVPAERRAEANAVLNIGGYIPAGLMPMATGLVIDRAGLATGAICFAVALAVIAVAGGFFVGRNLAEAEDQP